jgi:hypothetical protein
LSRTHRRVAVIDGEVAAGSQVVRAVSGSGSKPEGVDFCGGPVLFSAGGAPRDVSTAAATSGSRQGKW